MHIHIHSNPHKPLNPLQNTLRTRPSCTNMRLKPKLLPQIIPRGRPNSSDKHPPPSPSLSLRERPKPKNPQHSLTPRRRENNNPNHPITPTSVPNTLMYPHQPPKIPLKRPHHTSLINNDLLNPNPPLAQRRIHQRPRNDIAPHLTNKKEE